MNTTYIFLNIIILFNPNQNNIKYEGISNKNISYLNQFISFYNSIKLNLKLVDYRISIVHYDDFSENELNQLNQLDVDLIKTDIINNNNILTDKIKYLSIERYIVNTKIKGTHRLIAETDMLLLKEPDFDWNVDFQFQYEGNLFNKTMINSIIKKYNLKELNSNYNWNISTPYKYYADFYYKNKDKNIDINNTIMNILPPSINNGLVLVKEDFSINLYNNYLKPINETLFIYFQENKQWTGQWVMGPILLSASSNWKPFNPMINYIMKSLNGNKKGIEYKDEIQLIHYCGNGSSDKIKKHYPELIFK